LERGVADDRQGDAACLLCGGSLTSACVSTGRAQPLFPGNTARPQMTGDGTKQAVCQTATHQIISRPGPRSSPDPLIASNSSKIAPRRRRSGPPPPRATPGRSDRPGEIRRRTSQRIGGSRLATAARPIGQSSGRLAPGDSGPANRAIERAARPVVQVRGSDHTKLESDKFPALPPAACTNGDCASTPRASVR